MSEEIKETEIMIGNIVMVDNPKCHPHLKNVPMMLTSIIKRSDLPEYAITVEWVQKDIYDVNVDYPQLIRFIRFIPLTEDILIKCGFERESFSLGIEYIYNSPYFYLASRKDAFYYCERELKYLYQFQNLFKAFTQTDLKVAYPVLI